MSDARVLSELLTSLRKWINASPSECLRVLTTPHNVGYRPGVVEVQQKLLALQKRGWTIPAIAQAIGMSTSAVEKWKAGDRNPRGQKMVTAALDALLRKKRVPKRRRNLQKEGE